MKRRYLSLICIIAFMLSISGVNVRAQGAMPMVDGSYLTHDDEATGSAILVMRGEDLQTGTSKINKQATGVINAGGTTIHSFFQLPFSQQKFNFRKSVSKNIQRLSDKLKNHKL